MRSRLSIASFVVWFVLSVSLHAQPADWGDVPPRQLEMDTFPADSNASAVILSDVGEVSFDTRGRVVYRRHRRIKILTEGGYDWGTVELTYRAENRMERIEDIDGQTFTRSEDGEVERHELDGDDIFEEDVDGTYERKRFTLPALEPGAVIEYRYRRRSKNPILIPEWSFQTSEPTLWSEYQIEIPNRFRYVRIATGSPDFHIEEHQAVPGPWNQAMHHRWVMTDVPALREEPFMTTPEDYRARMAFQLKSYRTARGTEETFMSSWAELAEELLDRSDFGGQLDAGGDVRTRAELVVGAARDSLAKMKAIYDYVRTKVAWDGTRGFIPDRDVDEVLEAQSGSGPEIALLLVAMLRNVGLEAHPVLVSTRDHGLLQPIYPYLGQFNHVIVYVKTGDTPHLLDATDPYRPYTLLPVPVLNGRGWMVTEDGGAWLRIPRPLYRRRVNVAGTLSADGTIEAEVRTIDTQYSAQERRRSLREKEEEAFVRDVLLDGMGGVSVLSHGIENAASLEESLTSSVTFRAPAYAQAAGDFLYVNPTVLDRTEENPLRAPRRTFPVDLAYPRDLTYALALQLPKGFAVQEMPENVQVQLPDEGGFFQRLLQVRNGLLTLRARWVIAKTRFEPEYYEPLRAFYERVVAAQAEQIVLQRTDESTEATDTASAGGTGQ